MLIKILKSQVDVVFLLIKYLNRVTIFGKHEKAVNLLITICYFATKNVHQSALFIIIIITGYRFTNRLKK